jgi:type IV pilus assembly protein PilA
MLRLIRKRMKGEKGFTLIELLVVIIIIAILAAIAIPTFLGQRQKAQDAAAKSLVRNAMTSIEAYYVDTQDFSSSAAMTTALHAIEPSITFEVGGTCVKAPVAITSTGTALTKNNDVAYTGGTSTYTVVSTSASGNIFGVVVDKSAAGNTFVKSINSVVSLGW